MKSISNEVVERTHQHKVYLVFTCISINAIIILSLDIGNRQVSTAASLWFDVRQATSVCKFVLRDSSQFKVKLMTTCGTLYNIFSLSLSLFCAGLSMESSLLEVRLQHSHAAADTWHCLPTWSDKSINQSIERMNELINHTVQPTTNQLIDRMIKLILTLL